MGLDSSGLDSVQLDPDQLDLVQHDLVGLDGPLPGARVRLNGRLRGLPWSSPAGLVSVVLDGWLRGSWVARRSRARRPGPRRPAPGSLARLDADSGRRAPGGSWRLLAVSCRLGGSAARCPARGVLDSRPARPPRLDPGGSTPAARLRPASGGSGARLGGLRCLAAGLRGSGCSTPAGGGGPPPDSVRLAGTRFAARLDDWAGVADGQRWEEIDRIGPLRAVREHDLRTPPARRQGPPRATGPVRASRERHPTSLPRAADSTPGARPWSSSCWSSTPGQLDPHRLDPE